VTGPTFFPNRALLRVNPALLWMVSPEAVGPPLPLVTPLIEVATMIH